MTHSFKLSRRIAHHRAPMLAALMLIAACDSTNSLDQSPVLETPTEADPPTAPDQTGVELAPTEASLSGATISGIAMGTFSQPVSAFGAVLNGAQRIITPDYLLTNLAAIKSRGGRVVLDLAGSQRLWKDASGHFSMTKWKERVNRYKGINFSSYINDGTIIGHYLIDEPNDPTNWNGRIVPASTVEAMAQYSKQLWPNLPTIVRAQPDYMNTYSGTYRYLDAAWAQYVTRKGTASDYLKKNLYYAQKKGLALVVGLNISKGSYNGTHMTPSQVKSWGSTMLSSTYPCAFIAWQYESGYLSGSMKDALAYLRSKAQSRSSKTCRAP